VTPVALAAAVIVGDDVTAFIPFAGTAVHALVALVVAVILGGAVYGVFFILQRRLAEQAQALVPGA
jgi:uncharacterized protein HemX